MSPVRVAIDMLKPILPRGILQIFFEWTDALCDNTLHRRPRLTCLFGNMSTARLMVAASGHDADMLYATRFYADDPFVWWEARGKTHVALSPLEIDRARPVARQHRWQVHGIGEFLPPQAKDSSPAGVIPGIAAKYKLKSFLVPGQFPAGLLEALRRKGLKITVSDQPFFPATRAQDEGGNRRAGNRPARGGDRVCAGALTCSRRASRTGAAFSNGAGLPSPPSGSAPRWTPPCSTPVACRPIPSWREASRDAIRTSAVTAPSAPNEAIVLDIFPRHAGNFYYGDLTRTVVRGRASEALRKQYATVQEGKRWVMKQMRDGADGPGLQKALIARFKTAGYPTEQRDGRWVGMFHGVGHGLGLDLHESPRFATGKLFAGLSITVEPGLYYPGVGGVRHRGRRHRRQDRRAQPDEVRGGVGAGVMRRGGLRLFLRGGSGLAFALLNGRVDPPALIVGRGFARLA